MDIRLERFFAVKMQDVIIKSIVPDRFRRPQQFLKPTNTFLYNLKHKTRIYERLNNIRPGMLAEL